jgi:hypothetical protein
VQQVVMPLAQRHRRSRYTEIGDKFCHQ